MATDGKGKPKRQSDKETLSRSPFLEKLMAYLAVAPVEWPGDPETLPYVKELVEIECDHKIEWNTPDDGADTLESQVRRRRGELIQIICRDYPETAEKLLLHDLVSAPNEPFSHSEDYRSVTIRSKTYTLTLQQGQMIEILHEAQKIRKPDVAIAYILERLEKNSSRWQDTWKSNPKAKKALIKEGARKGTLRLNL
jgi:hypothetical protein